MTKLESFLLEHKDINKPKHLVIVTGQGKSSVNNIPHIKNATVTYLKHKRYSFNHDKINLGQINVYIILNVLTTKISNFGSIGILENIRSFGCSEGNYKEGRITDISQSFSAPRNKSRQTIEA